MKFNHILKTLALIIITQSCNKMSQSHEVLIGTYTRKEGHVHGRAPGIYWLQKTENAEGWNKSIIESPVNPSFIHLTEGNVLYAVSESGPRDGASSYLFSYELADGKAQKIDSIQTEGYAACHVMANQAGTLVMVANYVGGTIRIFRSNKGELTALKTFQFEGRGTHPRQDSSHPHMVAMSQDEQNIYVPDLGSNKIWIIQHNPQDESFMLHKEQPFLQLPKGAGPRHVAITRERMYVLNELNSTISVLSIDPENGGLRLTESIQTLPENSEVKDNLTAEIEIHPNDRFLYVSNRGHNSVAVFGIPPDGSLQAIQWVDTRGQIPRHFKIDPTGNTLWVANQNSDNICVFQISPDTGRLKFSHCIEDIKTPVCIAFKK